MSRFDTSTLLKKTSFFWPIILFPYYERSHTIVYTGQQTVKDVKFSVGFATLSLTDKTLCCRLIFPTILILEVELSDIIYISKVEGKAGILEIRFNKAKKGLLAKFALSGDPKIPRDRVLLNLGDESETWYRELSRRIPTRPATADNAA